MGAALCVCERTRVRIVTYGYVQACRGALRRGRIVLLSLRARTVVAWSGFVDRVF